MRLLLSFFFLFFLHAPAHAATEDISSPELLEVSFFGSEYKVNDTISLKGSNFGTDEVQLKINIHGKDYAVNKSYGNMLDFIVRSEMHSGQIYIKKFVNTDGKRLELESNRIDINFGEPQIQSIQAPKGFLPDKDLIIYGDNLKNARIWCGNTLLDAYKQEKEEVKIRIPNTFLHCPIEITYNEFLTRMRESIQILPIPKASTINIQNGNIMVNGEGFAPFQESLNKVSLQLGSRNFGASDYLSDSQIRFPKSQAIPAQGNAILTLDDTSLPPIAYDFHKDIPSILSISEVRLASDEKTYEFTVETNKNLLQIDGTPVLYLNSKKMTATIDKTLLRVSTTAKPKESASAWIEIDGFQGEEFFYNMKFDFIPKISTIYTLSDLRTSSGKIRIEGDNFFNQLKSKVKSSLGDLEIKNFRTNEIEVSLPLDGTEGDHKLSITTPFGTSADIAFSLPLDKGQTLYATAKIESLLFPNGSYAGERIIITGTALENILALQIEEKQLAPVWTNFHEAAFTLPKDIPLSGSLFLINQDRAQSNIVEYQLQAKVENPNGQLELSKKEVELIAESDEWQTLQEITLNNIFTEHTLNFELEFTCTQDCSTTLPFSNMRIINTDRKEQQVKITLDQHNQILRISQFTIPASNEAQTFSLQVKMFKKYQHDTVFTTALGYTQIRDNMNNEVKTIQKTDTQGSIAITSGSTKGFCIQQTSTDTWEDCSESLASSNQSTTADLQQIVEENTTLDLNEDTAERSPLDKETPQRDTKKKPEFKDLDTAQWYMPFIENLYQRGIINGFADGDFKPAGNLNRAELLKMVLVARGESWNSYATVHFEDTKTHWAKDMLEYALEKEYIKPSQNFQPLKTVTRAETTKMLCKMFPVLQEKENSETHFNDLKDHWSKDCVMAAFNAGIIQGTSSSRFSPDALITRAEFSKILSKFLELLE